MTQAFTYPNYPPSESRADDVRRRLELLPRNPGFFSALDAEMLAVFKTDQVRRALESNAAMTGGNQLTESAVVEEEEWAFSLMGI